MKTTNVASESPDGTFVIRTDGLHAHRHAELEVAGVPRAAVEAASKLIDYVVEGVPGAGRVLKDRERVGLPCGLDELPDAPTLFIGVRAFEVEPARGGWFKKKTPGVLRLADLLDDGPGLPRTAIATMMLYRANCRLALSQPEDALTELRASIELFPGESGVARMPELDTDDAVFNWQNHLSYLRLAELTTDEAARDGILRRAYERFTWLAHDHLGATPDELASLDVAPLEGIAARIIDAAHRTTVTDPGGMPAMVPSPIWSVDDDGATSVRRMALIPGDLGDRSFGSIVSAPDVRAKLAPLAARVVAHHRPRPWALAELTRDSRALFVSGEAPVVEVIGPRHPAHLLLGATIAEAGRCLVAGASFPEIEAWFGLTDDQALSASVADKLGALEQREAAAYLGALGL